MFVRTYGFSPHLSPHHLLQEEQNPRSIVDTSQLAIDFLTDEDSTTSQLFEGSGCSSNFFATCGSLWRGKHAGRLRGSDDHELFRMLTQRVRNGLLIPFDEIVGTRHLGKRSNHDGTRASLDDLMGRTSHQHTPNLLFQGVSPTSNHDKI